MATCDDAQCKNDMKRLKSVTMVSPDFTHDPTLEFFLQQLSPGN